MDYFAKIREFVVGNSLLGEAASPGGEKLFINNRTLDPTRMPELARFLESAYSIKVEPGEMLPENLGSVNRVIAFVAQKTVRLETEAKGVKPDLIAA